MSVPLIYILLGLCTGLFLVSRTMIQRRLPGGGPKLLGASKRTVIERMEEVGITVHKGKMPGPRAALLGDVYIEFISRFNDSCAYCKGRFFKLKEIVEKGDEGPMIYKYAYLGRVCDACGHTSQPERYSLYRELAVLRFEDGENFLDILDRLDRDWVPPEDEDPETIDAEIREFEARLNQARLRKMRAQHLTGEDLPEDPYRGDAA